MANSIDRRRSRAECSCPHRDDHSLSLLKKHGHDCPTDLSFWCANDILADIRQLEATCRVEGDSYDQRLRTEFGGIIERNLSDTYECKGVQVFWTLDEKSIEAHNIVGDDPRQRAINKAILELNSDYHSLPLLQAFVGFALGRSHLFTAEAKEEGVCLVVQPLLCLSPKKGSKEWPILVLLDTSRLVIELLVELRSLPHKAESELIGQIKGKIREKIGPWVASKSPAWPQSDFEARLRDNVERQDAGKQDFHTLFSEAAKHIALISIYQACNDLGAMSYILAPVLQGQCEKPSSLAIYWPRSIGEVSLNLLYLLQMILGQNATAILGEQRERRKFQQLAEARKMALGHLGHTLKNRLDTVQAFLDQHGQAGLSGHVRMLTDVTTILQLNTVDDRRELLSLEKRKRDRFLEYANDESALPLDLLSLIMDDWPNLVARKQPYRYQGQEMEAWCRLDMHSRISGARLTYALVDADGYRCRLAKAIYRELLFELLLNARRYGYVQLSPGERHDGAPVISVLCDVSSAEVEGRALLTLFNRVDPEKDLPAYLQSADWMRWPAERRYDGPGMALELLRRLELGDLFFRQEVFETGEVYFVVALDLLGLEIT